MSLSFFLFLLVLKEKKKKKQEKNDDVAENDNYGRRIGERIIIAAFVSVQAVSPDNIITSTSLPPPRS